MQKALGIACSAVVALLVLGCGSDSPPFSPASIEEIQREKAQSQPTPQMQPLPTTLPDLFPRGKPAATRPYYDRAATQPIRPTVRLTLQEVIHRTVANNLDVRVAGYQPAVDEARVIEAIAAFDPTVFSQLQLQRQFPQSIQPSLNPTEILSQQLQAGFRQRMMTGGQIELRAQTTRSEFDTRPFQFNPLVQSETVYDNQLVLQITQPLLRDFGTEVNRARITIARNDQKISQLEFRDELEKQLQKAEESYWQIYFNMRDLAIQEELLRQTDAMLDILVKRFPARVSMLEVSQARATVEQRAAGIVEIRSKIGDLSDQLKRIMNDPDLPISSPLTILPADEPIEEPVRVSYQDQLDIALQSRLELLQQKYRIDSQAAIRGAAKNNLLPQLTLQGNVAFEGLANEFGDATRNVFNDDSFISWSVGFQYEVPIGNRAARAIYQRVLLQQQQAIDQYRLLAENVASDLSQAYRQVFTAWDLMDAARKATFAARDALAAIEARETAGEELSYSFVQLKLDRQGALALAASTEARARASYNIAIAQLEKAKGTILQYNNVIMKEQRGPMFTKIMAAGSGK